jgi:hypothetical protein
MAFGIAQIGLRPADDKRLRTMVGMASITGAVSKQWRMCAPAEADVVVVALDDPEGQAALQGRSAYPHATFVALVGAADQVPDDCLKLRWPIRTEDVIELLTKIQSAPKTDSPASTRTVEGEALHLASILRKAAAERDPQLVWKITGTPQQPLYIAPLARKFFYQPPLARLRSTSLTELSFETVNIDAIPDDTIARPLVGLQWLVGDMIGPMGLLPWIGTATPLRLKTWPNFPVLHHDARHRRIAALLAQSVNSLEELVERSRMDITTVRSFVNASDLCGYLAPGAAVRKPDAKRVVMTRPRASLFERLRSALGIQES